MDDFARPPCWADGAPCPNACAYRHYWRVVYNHADLHGPWAGWRIAGARLVSPHREWIAPHQLDRVLFRLSRLTRYD